jgi:hypothetical protein
MKAAVDVSRECAPTITYQWRDVIPVTHSNSCIRGSAATDTERTYLPITIHPRSVSSRDA